AGDAQGWSYVAPLQLQASDDEGDSKILLRLRAELEVEEEGGHCVGLVVVYVGITEGPGITFCGAEINRVDEGYMIRQKKYVEELLDRNQAMAKHMAEMEEVITESEKPRNTTDLSFLSSVQIGEPYDKGAEEYGVHFTKEVGDCAMA
ncbi:unnamed protein product, partial [Effrenium voratum]